ALVHKLTLGSNSARVEDAVQGDVIKIFWTDKVGYKKSDNQMEGHLAIFDSIRDCDNRGPFACYWADNDRGDLDTPGDVKIKRSGWGFRCSPLDKTAVHPIHDVYVSKLTNLENLNDIPQKIGVKGSDDYSDNFLKKLENNHTTCDAMEKYVGIQDRSN